MNKNILIVLAGAISIAVVVALLVRVSLNGNKPAPVKKNVAKIEILVAAKDLKAGWTIEEGDFRWQGWDEGNMYPGLIARKDDQTPLDAVEGRLGRSLNSGEPLQRAAILKPDRGNVVAATLGEGMRAMAIEVSAASMVAGFITPGDYVDVVLTYKQRINATDESPAVQNMIARNLDNMATETILQNVRVLAVDQRADVPNDDDKKDKKVKVGRTVTVEVGVEDTERLSLASQLGDLNLVLRGVGDNQIVEKTWKTVSDARLVTVDDEIFDEFEKIQEDSDVKRDVIRVYSGSDVSSASVR